MSTSIWSAKSLRTAPDKYLHALLDQIGLNKKTDRSEEARTKIQTELDRRKSFGSQIK